MEKKIVFKTKDGGVAVITTAPNILAEINPDTGEFYTIDEIAAKDVPTGKKYKKVADSDLPANKNFRDAWVVDEADLTDGVGA